MYVYLAMWHRAFEPPTVVGIFSCLTIAKVKSERALLVTPGKTWQKAQSAPNMASQWTLEISNGTGAQIISITEQPIINE